MIIKQMVLGLLLVLALWIGGGCSPVPGRGLWGQQATARPGWQQVKNAAVSAATDPKTWVPAAGAVLFSFGELDASTSRWAVKHRPIFGGDPSSASDTLRSAMTAAYAVTALAAPSGDTAKEWTRNKTRGLAVGLAAMGANDLLTLGLKDLTSRQRPDRSEDESFPSGHASQAASRATLAARNLDFVAMPEWRRTTLKAGLFTAAVGTGWARVEAQQHFPSDVLAGFALGHFISAFVNEAFLTSPGTVESPLMIEPAPQGLGLAFRYVF